MINIAELLKDAPMGMKLYSPLFGEVKFVKINKQSSFPIVVKDCKGNGKSFTEFGIYFLDHPDAECLLFPSKDCRTWEGWKLSVEPKFKVGDTIQYKDNTYKIIGIHYDTQHYLVDGGTIGFAVQDCYHLWTIKDAKDGDVLVTEDYIFIFKYILHGGVHLYCHYNIDDEEFDADIPDAIIGNIHDKGAHFRPATKEQCDLLFSKMKEAGYIWDEKQKVLKKIQVKSKFKVGDWITNGTFTLCIVSIVDGFYYFYGGGYLDFGKIDGYYHLWTIADAKDGDVLIDEQTYTIGIFKEINKTHWYSKIYCGNSTWGSVFRNGGLHATEATKPATKEQCDLLFRKMREVGCEWDADKKELRKIINPKFKVGDEIKTGNTIDTIAEVGYATRSYYCESGRTISFENQDLWHLVSKPHYDISNFKPFQKVLVRDADDGKWMAAFYSHYMYEEKGYPYQFATIGTDIYEQCIPFEGNEHLFRTTDMCEEKYINW